MVKRVRPAEGHQERTEFADRLKKFRISCGLTQQDAARKCEMSTQSWWYLEGARYETSTASLRKIARGLECGPDVIGWLVLGEPSGIYSLPAHAKEAIARIERELKELARLDREAQIEMASDDE